MGGRVKCKAQDGRPCYDIRRLRGGVIGREAGCRGGGGCGGGRRRRWNVVGCVKLRGCGSRRN